MPIDVLCPGCGKTLRLADAHAGKTGRCPNCQSHFQIPTLSPPNTTEPTVAPGFDQLVSQLQPPASKPPTQNPPNQPPERKSLFGENQLPAMPIANSPAQNPFADSHTPVTNKPDYSNPYAAPQATSSIQPASSSNPGNDAAIPIVMGIVSIGMSVIGVCCCFTTILAIPMSIFGLVLTYRLPKDYRTFPLVLNILALVISLGWLLFTLALVGIQAVNDPQFR